MNRSDLLIVAGEASGDRIAALVARSLDCMGVRARLFGVAGPAARAAGVESIARAEAIAAMGALDVAARLPALAGAVGRVAGRVLAEPPRAALLVNFTELNQRLGRILRARGVRVLWCVAPQVWAWRPGRIRAVRGAVDRLAVILPFEEALWRRAGVDATYVGHPSLDVPREPRAALRERLGIGLDVPAVAVLPGSRPGEVARLAEPLCAAAARLCAEGVEARLLLATGLDARARARVERAARGAGIAISPADPEHGAASLLGAFDAALCASGTATLEAALAGAAPIAAYRLDPLAFAIARRLVRTPHVALPNVLLGQRVFPEIVQDEVTPERLCEAARGWLGRREEAGARARELRAMLEVPAGGTFGERVAGMIAPWLG